MISLFLNKNICCDPSLEPSRRDGSNDGSQHKFQTTKMENYLWCIALFWSRVSNGQLSFFFESLIELKIRFFSGLFSFLFKNWNFSF